MKKLLFSFSILFITLSISAQTKVKFYTTLGDFTVLMEDTLAPITAGSFISLVKEGYYDGVSFHRVINNFMIQGGRGATKPTIQDEFIAGLSNVRGTISMANTGAVNSGTTQFFINLIDNTRLDFDKAPSSSKHPVFGHVIENFNIVQDIGKAPVNNSVPNPAIYMDSLRIMAAPKDTSNGGGNGGGGNQTSTIDHKQTSQPLIDFYPNPIKFNSIIKIQSSNSTTTVKLYNVLGNELEQITIDASEQETELRFSEVFIQSLSSGIYLLEAHSTAGSQTIRLVYP